MPRGFGEWSRGEEEVSRDDPEEGGAAPHGGHGHGGVRRGDALGPRGGPPPHPGGWGREGSLLVRLLGLPHVKEGRVYTWPSAAGARAPDQDWESLEAVFTEEEIAQWRRFGAYIGYRVGITGLGRLGLLRGGRLGR